MMVLAGADLVLPTGLVSRGTLIVRDGRIEAIETRHIDGPSGATRIDCSGQVIVPGFIDVHVHGVEGIDVLDGGSAVAEIARRLPKFGVTGFCPTSVACDPATLSELLTRVTAAQSTPAPRSARVLPAHLESNFIHPAWNGAQPRRCLRLPTPGREPSEGDFSTGEILAVIARHGAATGIITLAPELPGGMDLVRRFVAAGHRVSLGHTGATYDEARAAIAAGVHHATHLFNRMSSLTSRSPGVVGAVLESDAVAAEIICDGCHVHPALMSLAIRMKTARRLMAITDGTAGSGLPVGSRTRLGVQDPGPTRRGVPDRRGSDVFDHPGLGTGVGRRRGDCSRYDGRPGRPWARSGRPADLSGRPSGIGVLTMTGSASSRGATYDSDDATHRYLSRAPGLVSSAVRGARSPRRELRAH